jgi:hypothetical protein
VSESSRDRDKNVRAPSQRLKSCAIAAILLAHLSRAAKVRFWLKPWQNCFGVHLRFPFLCVVLAALLQWNFAHAAKTPFTTRTRGALDLGGHPVDPLNQGTNKATVLIFVSCDCPISNRYAPEIRRLHAKFAPKGIKFWLVYPNGDETSNAIRQHTNDYQIPCPVLRDPQHAVVKQSKATITPEAVVYIASGKAVYRGRIDNRYVVLGKERPHATQHDLDATLQAILDGKPVPASHPAVGCYIADR